MTSKGLARVGNKKILPEWTRLIDELVYWLPGAWTHMVFRRNLYLAWLALTLNALAPVIAYAHIHIGAHGEVIEHCAADEPDEPGDADAQDQHSHSSKGTVPHCQYCAGFAAGVSLAFGGVAPGNSGPPQSRFGLPVTADERRGSPSMNAIS